MQPKPERTPIPVFEVGKTDPYGYVDDRGNWVFTENKVNCDIDPEHDIPINKEYDQEHNKMPKSRIDEDTRKKSYCRYCKSYSYDDSVGNCSACGGPGEEPSRDAFTRIDILSDRNYYVESVRLHNNPDTKS